MEDKKPILTSEQIGEEAGKRFKDEDGGYDLWSIEAFTEGAELAVKLMKEKRGLLNPSIIEDGYNWAVMQMNE